MIICRIKSIFIKSSNRRKILTVILSLILPITVVFGLTMPTYAIADASFSFSPSSGNFNINDTINVIIKVNGGSNQFNGAEADVNYDPAILEYVKATLSETFDVFVPTKTSAGLVCIPAGSSSTLSGDHNFATITFKAKSPGTVSLIFVNGINACSPSTGTVIVSGSNNVWNKSISTASFTIKGTTSTTTSTPATTTSPTLRSTSNSSSSTSTSSNTQNSSSIVPPVATSSESEQVNTVNYMAIKVVDSSGKIVVGAKVTIDGKYTAISDATGVASFANIPEGKHTVKTESDGKATTQFIDVKGVSSTKPQEYSVKLGYASKNSSNKWLIYAAILLVVVLLIFLIIIYKKIKKKKEFYSQHNLDKIDFDKPSNEKAVSGINQNTYNNNPNVPVAGTVVDPTRINNQLNSEQLNGENNSENN